MCSAGYVGTVQPPMLLRLPAMSCSLRLIVLMSALRLMRTTAPAPFWRAGCSVSHSDAVADSRFSSSLASSLLLACVD